MWRCPGAVPPGWRLFLLLAHSGCTAPGAVMAFGARVARIADARTLFPVMRRRLGLVLHLCELLGARGMVPFGIPIVHLLPHPCADEVPHLAPELQWPALPEGATHHPVLRVVSEHRILRDPQRGPVALVDLPVFLGCSL